MRRVRFVLSDIFSILTFLYCSSFFKISVKGMHDDYYYYSTNSSSYKNSSSYSYGYSYYQWTCSSDVFCWYLIGSLIMAAIIFIISFACHCSRCGRREGEKIENLVGEELILYRGGLNSDWDMMRWCSICYKVPCGFLTGVNTCCPGENPTGLFLLCCLPGILLGSLAALVAYAPFKNLRLKDRESFTLAVTTTNLCVSQNFQGCDTYDISTQIPIQTILKVVDSSTCGANTTGIDVYLKKEKSMLCCPPAVTADFTFEHVSNREDIKNAINLAKERHEYMEQHMQQYNQNQRFLQSQQYRQQQQSVTMPTNQSINNPINVGISGASKSKSTF